MDIIFGLVLEGLETGGCEGKGGGDCWVKVRERRRAGNGRRPSEGRDGGGGDSGGYGVGGVGGIKVGREDARVGGGGRGYA